MRLSVAVRKYISWKQLRGLRFYGGERSLTSFLRRIGDCQLGAVTSMQVSAFLDGPNVSPATWWAKHRRFGAFFKFWISRGQLGRLPMPRPRAAWPSPFRPYIYSTTDLTRMMKATELNQGGRSCRLDSITLKTFLLFLYGTGSLVSEALSLCLRDIDLRENLITVRRASTGMTRTLPIGRNLRIALDTYLASSVRRRGYCTNFFINNKGRPIPYPTLMGTFQRLRVRACIRRENGVGDPPAIRDLRHTFGVHCLAAWLKRGGHPDSLLPALSAYMGHAKWNWTERYLALTPDRFWKQLSVLARPQRKDP